MSPDEALAQAFGPPFGAHLLKHTHRFDLDSSIRSRLHRSSASLSPTKAARAIFAIAVVLGHITKVDTCVSSSEPSAEWKDALRALASIVMVRALWDCGRSAFSSAENRLSPLDSVRTLRVEIE